MVTRAKATRTPGGESQDTATRIAYLEEQLQQLTQSQKEPREPRKPAAVKEMAAKEISVWEDDPLTTPSAQTIKVPVPELDIAPLAIEITGNMPTPEISSPGTAEFRYWTAAAALGRAVTYWRGIFSDTELGEVDWEVGSPLPVRLDVGVDLNAFYARDANQKGLSFFHDTIAGQTIYSGESSDVVCHELGHAILDSIRPDLFDAASDEIAAFHESFGDMSAILSDLQIKSLREAVLAETNRDLHRSSRLSRLAEQLGWAIRQIHPDQADPDCLRNAVNSFFYQDPTLLLPSGPNSILTSEPHSFSRVFTASFFEALGSMVALQAPIPAESDLLQASQDAGRLLIEALLAAPASSDFYSQVAAHMIGADKLHFSGKYSTVLTSAFVRHGILSLESAAMIGSHLSSPALATQAMTAAGPVEPRELPQVTLSAINYGLRSKTLLVSVPGEAKRLPAASATSEPGVMTSPSAEKVAKSFVDDLFQRGKVDVGESADISVGMIHPTTRRKTHKLIQTPRGLVLTRMLFD